MSFIKARAPSYGIKPSLFHRKDVHIHLPEGAVPKDGPSAGIAITTALLSALTDRPVRHDVAMTGEVTLAGLVLPVGGIKEKVLAARSAGVKHIILPAKNEKDLEEIPPNVMDELSFHFVNKMDEVIKFALTAPATKAN